MLINTSREKKITTFRAAFITTVNYEHFHLAGKSYTRERIKYLVNSFGD
jgi:hypothetical protein